MQFFSTLLLILTNKAITVLVFLIPALESWELPYCYC